MSYSQIFNLIILIIGFLLHFVTPFVTAYFSGRKVNKICEKCFTPVVEAEPHTCLTPEQLELVEKLVLSLRGNDNGNE